MGVPDIVLENDMNILVGGFEYSVFVDFEICESIFFSQPLLFSIRVNTPRSMHPESSYIPTVSSIASLSSNEVNDVRRSLGDGGCSWWEVGCGRSRMKLSEDGLHWRWD